MSSCRWALLLGGYWCPAMCWDTSVTTWVRLQQRSMLAGGCNSSALHPPARMLLDEWVMLQLSAVCRQAVFRCAFWMMYEHVASGCDWCRAVVSTALEGPTSGMQECRVHVQKV